MYVCVCIYVCVVVCAMSVRMYKQQGVYLCTRICVCTYKGTYMSVQVNIYIYGRMNE